MWALDLLQDNEIDLVQLLVNLGFLSLVRIPKLFV